MGGMLELTDGLEGRKATVVLLVGSTVEFPGGLVEDTVALLVEAMVEFPDGLGRGAKVLVRVTVNLLEILGRGVVVLRMVDTVKLSDGLGGDVVAAAMVDERGKRDGLSPSHLIKQSTLNSRTKMGCGMNCILHL